MIRTQKSLNPPTRSHGRCVARWPVSTGDRFPPPCFLRREQVAQSPEEVGPKCRTRERKTCPETIDMTKLWVVVIHQSLAVRIFVAELVPLLPLATPSNFHGCLLVCRCGCIFGLESWPSLTFFRPLLTGLSTVVAVVFCLIQSSRAPTIAGFSAVVAEHCASRGIATVPVVDSE